MTMHELILGGARSGKSRRAEALASDWLAADPAHEAVLVATALAADDEMRERIARHRHDRAARAPGLRTQEMPAEAPQDLPRLLAALGDAPQRLCVVDCLTLWLTQCLLPPPGHAVQDWPALEQGLVDVLQRARGPIVLVSNEIGLGVLPMAREARACVDALGLLHQRVAGCCARVTLMVAGLPLAVKEPR